MPDDLVKCIRCGTLVEHALGLWKSLTTGKFMCPDGLPHHVEAAS